MPSFDFGQPLIVLPVWDKKSLLDVLAEAFSLSKGKAKQLLDQKRVFVNNRRVWIAKHAVRTGDKIEVTAAAGNNDRKQAQEKLEILFEDQWCLVINKPANIVSNGPRSLEEKLQTVKKSKTLKVVHRLDRDTTGVIIAAKNQEVFEKFKQIFAEHKIVKMYSALVVGYGARPLHFKIDTPLDGKSAFTEVWCKKTYNRVSLIEVKILTGRTHQIRRHLQSANIAILGDKEYSNKASNSAAFRAIGRQMLHALQVEFEHPVTKQKMKIRAKYPKDFEALLESVKEG